MAYLNEFLACKYTPTASDKSRKVHENYSNSHATVRELVFSSTKQEPRQVRRKFTAFTIDNILADKGQLHLQKVQVEETNSNESSPSQCPSPSPSISSTEAEPIPTCSQRLRCNRTSFSDVQLMILERIFQFDPYPNSVIKQKLALRLQVPELTIVNWFKKRRTWWRQGDKKLIQNVARATKQGQIPTQQPRQHAQAAQLQMNISPAYQSRNLQFDRCTETRMSKAHTDWSAAVAFSSHPASTFMHYHPQSSTLKHKTGSSFGRYHPYSQHGISNPVPYSFAQRVNHQRQ